MGFLSDLLVGQNKWQIDNAYKKQVDDLGAEKSRSFFSDLEQSDLYNKNKDYFNSIGLTENPYNAEARMANSNAYAKALGDLEDERAREWKKNKFNIAGNGLVGAFANPLIQVGDIAGDMFASPFRAIAGEETNRYRRDPEKDFLSDVGAIGDTALNAATFGAGAGALKGGQTLGKAMKTQALIGAGNSAMSTLRENGGYTDFGNLLANTAIGGAVGGALGGGLYGLGKLSNLTKSIDKGAASDALSDYARKMAPYQDAVATLRKEGLEGASDDAINAWIVANHPDKVQPVVGLLPSSTTPTTIQEASLTAGQKINPNLLPDEVKRAMSYNVRDNMSTGLKEINAANLKNATDRFSRVNDALDVVKAGMPGAPDLSAIPRVKAGNLKEAMFNLRNNLQGTRLSRAGTKVSGLLKTKAGKVGAGIGGGLLLANLLRGGGGTPASEPELTDEELYYLLTEGGY